MNHEPAKELVTLCVGRFCLDTPTGMSRLSDSYRLQHITLEETLWKDPKDAGRGGVWEAHLAAIQALEAERKEPSEPQGTILEKRVLEPGVLQGVLFHRFDVPEIVTWGALLRTGPVDVWLQIDSDPDRQEEGAKRVQEVAGAYRPANPGEALPLRGKDVYYLRHGLVALPTKYMEEATVRVQGTPLDVTLEVSTDTVTQVDKESLLEKLSQTMAMAGEDLGDLMPQRSRRRKVAGLDGEELILRSSEGEKGRLFFLWSFPGEKKSGARPHIEVRLEGSLEKEDDKISLWNHLLESFRPAAGL